MDAPEHRRNYSKWDVEESLDTKGDKVGDEEDWEGSDKRRPSSKSIKHSIVEETEGWDNSGKRKSSGNRTEGRKRTGGSSRVGSVDEDDYDTKKELRSKQANKNQDERTEKRSDSGYQDRELESTRKGRDVSWSRGEGPVDESERNLLRKMSSKTSDRESSQSKSRSKVDSSHDRDQEKTGNRDSKYSERKESSRDKGSGSRDQDRKPKRRWDESDSVRKAEESNYVDVADSRSGKASEVKHGETKSRAVDSASDKGIKSVKADERRVEEKSKSKGRSEAQEEYHRSSFATPEERSGGLRDDKQRRDREEPSELMKDVESSAAHRSSMRGHGGHDFIESRARSVNTNRSMREGRHSKQSWTPERGGIRCPESDDSESDNERSIRDDRSKGRVSSWSERNRDQEGSKDNWKKRPHSNTDKETKDGDVDFRHEKEWELRRLEREKTDNEKLQSQSGYKKTRSRTEGVKTSSNYGNSNDMVECGRDESGSTYVGSKVEMGCRQSDFTSEDEWGYLPEDRTRITDVYSPGDDLQERFPDDGFPMLDQNSGRKNIDMEGGKGKGQNIVSSSNRNSGSIPPFGNNQGGGSFNRMPPQGAKTMRFGRGGRGRITGRDGGQGVGIPLPMMGTPFGPLGLPSGPMQPLGPNISPAHAPPIGLGVFIPPFLGPNIWPGARGVDMNMLSVSPGLSSIPPGLSMPRFSPNMGTNSNPAMYFNQSGPTRGFPLSSPGSSFNSMGTMGRGMPRDKTLGGWGPRTGKAPSRGEQNDYSQNFVDTGMRPQNFIRELELTNVVEDYPKLRELIQKKDEIVAKSASPPMYYKCDLREFVLTSEFFGTKFDVILIDPPWEEYVHRAPGVADHMEYWTFEEILGLKIEAIADIPSVIFLWVGDGVGLEQGRQCLKKWGFRRCEDICWVKTNKTNAAPSLRHDSHTLFQHSKEHCLMGIKGMIRRSTDGHIIHANIDTDIIIAEEPPYGSTKKPDDMYRIIEHFSLGRRRLELFGEDHNIRSGWLTVGKGLSSSNFNAEAYVRNFADKDGKVWQGGGGQNPPPESPHLVMTTPEIECLRPKSPPPKNQQQQQLTFLSQTTVNSTNRRPVGNSPQKPAVLGLTQEANSSNPLTPARWAPIRGPDVRNVGSDDKLFDGYGYNPACGQSSGEHLEFESQGSLNLL